MTPGAGDLDDAALAAALTERGTIEPVVDRLVAEREDPYVATLLDRFLTDTPGEP